MSEISREWNESSGRRRAAPYIRVSASQQEAYSLDEQRDALLRFAEESGHDVVDRYEDTGGYPEEGEEIA